MSRELSIEILTPNRVLLREQVSEVYFPAYDGERGVLPGHSDFIGLLGTGVLRAVKAQHRRYFMLSGGLYAVRDGVLSFFAEVAEGHNDIDCDKASSRVAEIEQTFADLARYKPEDYDKLKFDYVKNQARVEVCRRSQAGA